MNGQQASNHKKVLADFGPHCATTAEVAALRHAFDLAAQGPTPNPNPQVGCVLLDPSGKILAQGWHRGANTPHAEAAALEHARAQGVDVRGATAVVTLEPCAHQGRTPSCAHALNAAGISRVIFSAADPTQSAQGGSQVLRQAGVVVVGGVLHVQGEDFLAPWLQNPAGPAFPVPATSSPWIVAKWAMTLDGRIAARDGTSQWITGPQAREHAHQARAETQALIVGTGTLLADNPRLTARASGSAIAGPQPLKVVVGNREIPRSARVRANNAPVLQVRSHSPADVVEALRRNGISHAIIDGGPTVTSAFLAAGLVNEIHAYVAPAILGDGPSVVSNLGVKTLSGALRFHISKAETLGSDALLTLTRTP